MALLSIQDRVGDVESSQYLCARMKDKCFNLDEVFITVTQIDRVVIVALKHEICHPHCCRLVYIVKSVSSDVCFEENKQPSK